MRERGPVRCRLDPWTNDRPGPLEVLARLAGTTTFREPGSGGRPTVTTEDVAHALGCVHDRLSQMLALAIATGNRMEWVEIQRIGHHRLLNQLLADRRTRLLVAGANKFRARIVFYDAFHDLVPGSQVKWREAAKRCCMQEQAYRELHRAITGFMNTEAVSAARQACSVLFSRDSSFVPQQFDEE